jgi:CBS domain-containing protein
MTGKDGALTIGTGSVDVEAAMLVREVMTSPAVTVTPYTTAREALRLLDECRITALPVVNDDGGVVGVISEADLLALLPGVRPTAPLVLADDAATRRVGELMTYDAVTVRADGEVAEALELLTSTGRKSLPVVLNERIAGVVSRSDLVRVLAHTDDRIRYELLGLVRAKGVNWTVEVTDGVVTVSGSVTERQRQDAEAMARSVAGVVGVRVQ